MPETVTVTCDVKVSELNPHCINVLVSNSVIAIIRPMYYVDADRRSLAGYLYDNQLYRELKHAVLSVLGDWERAVQNDPPDLLSNKEDL